MKSKTSFLPTKVLVYDTETTGLPKDYKAPHTDVDNWPRLVQLSFQLLSIQTPESEPQLIRELDFIIKPDGFEIPKESSNIHGITQEIANEKGVTIKRALKYFVESLQECDYVVAHNVEFDRKIVGAEFVRMGIKPNCSSRESICTKELGTDLCKIPNPYSWGGQYKWPSLQELHKHLFGVGFEDAHNSKVDVEATVKCFFEMVKTGWIEL